MEYLFNGFTGSLINALIIMLLTIILKVIVIGVIGNWIKRNKYKDLATFLIFCKKIINFFIMFIGILLALYQFEIFKSLSITLLSGIGVVITVLGLGMQNSIGNVIASFELILTKPFKIGDFIKLPEKSIAGTVEDISLRHTVIRTTGNQREIIPNSLLNDLIIENANFIDNKIILTEEYSVAYSADLEKAIEILKEEIKKACDIELKEDIEFPKVRVSKWDSSSIKLRAYIWGNDLGEAYNNLFELNKNLKIRYDKENIEIPYDYVNVITKK